MNQEEEIEPTQMVLSDKEEVNVKDLYPRRDFIYIKDLIEALLVTQDLNRGFRVYNIGSGISLSVDEVINIIQNEAGTNKKKVCDNKSRSHEILDVFADYSKIKQELGWEPKISFKDGIAEILNYERNKVRL